jgi:protein-S-isoprenylcysteine O-methyltransferase Ste14/membrane protease YdiL (CAAX protease family)
MTGIEQIELWIRWLGGSVALLVLIIVLAGILRGLRRPAGRETENAHSMRRSPIYYLLAAVGFFGLVWLLWLPLPLDLSVSLRICSLICGGLLYLSGLGLVLWGRLELGKHYFVSTARSAALFADHRLVTSGPYAWMRHPMYSGLALTALGGLLLYRTWAFVFLLICFLAVLLRARPEERVLVETFGEEWQAYCRRVPRFVPRPAALLSALRRLPDAPAALLEIALWFLPAIPAYLWVWPNISGKAEDAFQLVAYAWFLAGALWIGLRRWRPTELGLNTRGLGLSLFYGVILIAGRSLVILAVDWGQPAPTFTPLQIIGKALFYFLAVGLSEELLFRGLIYRALLDWRGMHWAVVGSSLAFGLWHVFGQGPLVGIAMVFYGLIFALLRYRAGGILGLVIVHGLIDFSAVLLMPSLDVASLGYPAIPRPAWMLLGLALILLLPLLLWVGSKFRHGRKSD